MNTLLVLPILLPLCSAALGFILFRSARALRVLGLCGSAALFIASLLLLRDVWLHGTQAVQVGGWAAPFGITLVADLFSAIMVAVTGVVGLAVAVYAVSSIDHSRQSFGFYPLVNLLLMGVCGAFLTGDLFNLFVWFEVMLIASFVLIALGGEPAQLRGALKYVAINLLSSALFLSAVGILYGLTGALNMAHLAVVLEKNENPGLLLGVAMLLLVSFGVKAAVFPLFFWLPASYHTPPIAISALFAGLLTKVGVYAMIRVFTLIFIQDPEITHRLILVIAGFTMVTGVLGAMIQDDIRRILSFHIISQIGYMVMGLGLFSVAGLAGSVFYIVHHIIVKTNLFLVGGIANRVGGSFHLKKLGGLYAGQPLLAWLFLIPALSLAGMPPFSGFFAKLSLIQAGLADDAFAITAVALLVGLLTLYSMSKIWTEAFWRPKDEDGTEEEVVQPGRSIHWMTWPVISLATITVIIGLTAGPLFTASVRAAEELMDRESYITAVLGAYHK